MFKGKKSPQIGQDQHEVISSSQSEILLLSRNDDMTTQLNVTMNWNHINVAIKTYFSSKNSYWPSSETWWTLVSQFAVTSQVPSFLHQICKVFCHFWSGNSLKWIKYLLSQKFTASSRMLQITSLFLFCFVLGVHSIYIYRGPHKSISSKTSVNLSSQFTILEINGLAVKEQSNTNSHWSGLCASDYHTIVAC